MFSISSMSSQYILVLRPPTLNWAFKLKSWSSFIDWFGRKVTSFSSSSSIASSYYVLTDCVGHYDTWICVSFCCKHRGHKSYFSLNSSFSTLPTGANPVDNFVCHLASPHGRFLFAFVTAGHTILYPYSMGKDYLFSYQYGTDSFFRRCDS